MRRVLNAFALRAYRLLVLPRRPLEADVYRAAVSQALVRAEILRQERAALSLGRDFKELATRIYFGFSKTKNRHLTELELGAPTIWLRRTRKEQERSA